MSDATQVDAPEVELDLGWLEQMGEWGIRAKPGKQGLSLADIQTASYGDVPVTSDNQTGRPARIHFRIRTGIFPK